MDLSRWPHWVSDDGAITLINADCLAVLPTLEPGSVDAVVTDPPYGIGFDYADAHDDRADEYAGLICKFVIEATRIGPSSVWVWQALLHADKFHRWFPAGFRIFAACKGFVQFRPTPVQWSWDPVVWWGKPKREPSVYAKDWHVQSLAPFGANRESIDHPCPRPLEQVMYVVTLASTNGDSIIDPFMGSGTTGVACIRTGRRFIGIEISKEYYRIAKKRIQAELAARDGKGPIFEASMFAATPREKESK